MATFAVMPVLIGPLQVLLALLPAVALAVGGGLIALFKPSGLRKLARFLWHQKLFSACLVFLAFAIWQGYPRKVWSGVCSAMGWRVVASAPARTGEWPTARGNAFRTGYAGGDEPTAAGSVWAWNDHKTVYSSPTVAGDRVYFTTVTGIGPFTPTGKGAVVCVDAESGRELWRYDGDDGDLRGTFSSPAVGDERIVVGEGLHQTSDARVTCLDLAGRKVWDFRTASHVESTPCIHGERVFVAAAGDGFYCFDLKPTPDGQANVLWHLQGERYPDCESSPVSDGRTVWFGLGEGGNTLVAVDAVEGTERWRVPTPYPVFAAPTLVQDSEGTGRLYVGMGNGNFVLSADELRAAKVESLREEGKSSEEIAAAEKALATAGEVWCLNAATGELLWSLPVPDTVLGSIAYQPAAETGQPDRLFFGSRDGHVYSMTSEGKPIGKWNAGAPILASPALATKHVYIATKPGRLIALQSNTLQPAWDMTVQQAGTLTSSPAVADGHVFVGTEDEGLRCVGTTEPPTPPRSNPVFGGSTDEMPIPDRLEVAWQFLPPAVGRPFESFPQRHIIQFLGLDGAIFATTYGGGDGGTLTRMDYDDQNETRPAVVWQRASPGQLFGGVGTQIFVRSSMLNPRRVSLESLDIRTGKPNWRKEWPNDNSAPPEWHEEGPRDGYQGIGFDEIYLYVWTGLGRLTCVRQSDGTTVWTTRKNVATVDRKASHPIGRPVRFGDLILCSGEYQAVALDRETGTFLWESALSSRASQSPTVVGMTVVIPVEGGLTGLDLRTGKADWHVSYPSITILDVWAADPELLIACRGNEVVLIDSRNGEVVNEPQKVKPPIFDFPYRDTGIRQKGEILVSHIDRHESDAYFSSFQWWNPKEESLRPSSELGDLGQYFSSAIAVRGRVYLATPKNGLVCLRGVKP